MTSIGISDLIAAESRQCITGWCSNRCMHEAAHSTGLQQSAQPQNCIILTACLVVAAITALGTIVLQ